MEKYSKGWIRQQSDLSKARLIELGIYVKDCDISYKEREEQVRAKNHINNRVRAGKLAHINTLKCLNCGTQAEHYHHNKSYLDSDLDKVVPLCQSCHRQLHSSIESGNYYIPTKEQLSDMYLKYQSTLVVSKLIGVHQGTIQRWLHDSGIKVNEGTRALWARRKKEWNDTLISFFTEARTYKSLSDELGVNTNVVNNSLVKFRRELPKDELERLELLRNPNKNRTQSVG